MGPRPARALQSARRQRPARRSSRARGRILRRVRREESRSARHSREPVARRAACARARRPSTCTRARRWSRTSRSKRRDVAGRQRGRCNPSRGITNQAPRLFARRSARASMILKTAFWSCGGSSSSRFRCFCRCTLVAGAAPPLRSGAWPLAGNGLLPSPGLSFPAALRFAGAPRTPPGRFRALHITRALCAEGARRSAHQLARAGAWRRRSREVGGFEKRRKNFRARLRRGRCRRVTLRASLRARHLRSSFLRVLDPARGTVRAAPGAGKSTGDSRAARLRRAAGGRARPSCPARSPGLARACRARGLRTAAPPRTANARARSEARAMTGLQAARATRALLNAPGGLTERPVLLKAERSERPEARGVPPAAHARPGNEKHRGR